MSRSFVGWRLSAGADYDHVRESRDRKKQEDATFSGHSDERLAFLFSEDEKRLAYYHRAQEFFSEYQKRDWVWIGVWSS